MELQTIINGLLAVIIGGIGWAAISSWNLGLKNLAVYHATNAVSFAPDDDRLLNNLNLMRADEEKT